MHPGEIAEWDGPHWGSDRCGDQHSPALVARPIPKRCEIVQPLAPPEEMS